MKKLLLLGLVLALLPVANVEAKTIKKAAGKNSQSTFELNVAHINDHHSHLEEEKMPIKLDGKTVTVHIGGLPRVGQEIKNFRKNNKNTLVVHAGDAVTGTLYYTLFEGKADAELMNAINFDAYTLGNHEFDDGNKFLRSFLDALKIPVVSSNVVPDKGSILEGKWKPSSDTETHLALYRAFPEIGGVTHTHSVNAAAFAQAGLDIPALGTTHADYFYGDIPCTRALTEGETKSAYEKNTGAVIIETVRCRGYEPLAVPGALVRNHGPFAWGKNAADAVYHAVVMETAAEMALKTKLLNPSASLPVYILDEHYQRKHGPNATYGQGK